MELQCHIRSTRRLFLENPPATDNDDQIIYRERFVVYGAGEGPGAELVIAEADRELSAIVPSREERATPKKLWNATDIPQDQLLPSTFPAFMSLADIEGLPDAAVQSTAFKCGGYGWAARSRVFFGDTAPSAFPTGADHAGPSFDPSLLDRHANLTAEGTAPDPEKIGKARALPMHRFGWWATDAPGRRISSPATKPFHVSALADVGQGSPPSARTDPLRGRGTSEDEAGSRGKPAGSPGRQQISRLDAALAHILILINRARRHHDTQDQAYLDITLGLRRRVDPPLLDSFVGSPILLADIEKPRTESSTAGIGAIAGSIKRTMSKFTAVAVSAYLYDAAHEVSPQRLWQGFLGSRHTLVTSWVRARAYEVAFCAMGGLARAVLCAALAATATAVRTMIPPSSFNSQSDFDADWAYNYPWGTDHNGGARMDRRQVQFSNGMLTLTARKVSGQPDAVHGGKNIKINYLSGAIHAREHFNVSRGGGYDFTGEFKATTTRGTWPAFWLTAVNGWPPEIDMAEWKGSGKISFNTFNTSSVLSWKDVAYPTPDRFHSIKCEVRDINQRDVSVKFYMDGTLIDTHVGGNFFGKPMIINLQMEGSSGAPGPSSDTVYQLVTTPTADTPGTCIVLHFDNQRYVFGNIAEGTQRAMVQRKVALNKAENLFLSGVINWQNAGGLMGTILTIADVLASAKENQDENARKKKNKAGLAADNVMPRLNIHGGKNLAHFLATSRRFIFRKGLPLRPQEIRHDPRLAEQQNNEPDFKDSNINVWYMPIESSNSRPTTSRKRSHEEFSEQVGGGSRRNQTPSSDADENQKLVETVVTQMFDSDWKMDALVETTLHQAKLPAKLFVRDEKGHIQVYSGPIPGGNEPVPDIPVLVRQPWPGAMVQALPRTTPSTQSMCYIVKGHDRRGRFNPKEAEKRGVAKPDYKILTMGQNVTGKDGTVVTPQMVLEPNVPGKGFAVVDVPDTSYIESLVKRTEWSTEEMMKGIHVFFWLLGPGVANDPRLQDFMTKMSSMRHIVTSSDTCSNRISLESAATQAYKLHCIDPERFPLPIFDNERSLLNTPVPSTSAYEVGQTGKTVQFAPQFLHQDDKVIPFPDIKNLAMGDTSKELREEVQQLAEQARTKISNPELLEKIEKVESDIPNRDAEVITLGTGSALPSKYRNVSATLVRVPGYGNYLFDCGENTLGQLRRVFGNELPEVIRDLKAIWISHLHADHHLGTAGVIRAWHDATSKSEETAKSKLVVASHVHMLDWLREYADVEDYGHERLVPVEFRNWDSVTKAARPRIFTTKETEAFGLAQIDACFVNHCYGALATVFTWPSGLKVAYSGDCRPSDAFARMGRGATLLIHESTFDDELRGDAVAKKHSTMSEAIDVGRRMGARRILLTHFSQRYQKIPILEEHFEVRAEEGDEARAEEKAKLDEVILVAFDYMRVRLGHFRKAQAFLPAIQKLFEDVETQ
ncbi:hypothetical protein DL766_005354 [Monosporascus sp. MC13-8B]|nr:hypothetical protein DL763_003816 [Monosporascus cannonballus]RYP29486.1 hypothetical protein DL766_005354 [Monosporascus sp. MC13-8B]